jgi:hypothetical protein
MSARLLAALARLLVRGKQREFVLGDLDELYARRAGRGAGGGRAPGRRDPVEE